jgi:Uma2 family endonuclease
MATLEDLDSFGSDESGPPVAQALLYEGQRLDQPTFHAIYEQMPEDFKAELIDGVVYLMNMPLYADHSDPDSYMIGLLFTYSMETPGTRVRNGITTKLGPGSEVQPDACLLIEPDFGGRTQLDGKGTMVAAPELVVEVGSSTLRRDLDAKKRAYEQAGALEYVVYAAQDRKFHWFILQDGRFELLPVDPDGLFRSRIFPGLWIDEAAFAAEDNRTLMAGLRRGLESPEHVDFVEQLRRNRANRP